MIQSYFSEKEKHDNVPLLRMVDNRHGGLPFFIRKYSLKGSSTNFHRHEYMQINYIYQGKGKHIVNNHQFDIIKGDIFVIPPYVPHCIFVSDDSVMEVFEFEFVPEFINQDFSRIENAASFMDFAYIEPFLVTENKVKPRLNILGKKQVEIENILNEALIEYNEKPSGYQLLIKSLLLKLLIIVGREFTSDVDSSDDHSVFTRYRDAIQSAVTYMEEQYSEDLCIEQMAKRFLLSQSYFSYLFKSITGKTFIEYLNGIRISKALELLKNTDKRVLDICYEVGFRNINHFNRMFRQLMGVSPMEYRKRRDL